jgi:hypothetical protein
MLMQTPDTIESRSTSRTPRSGALANARPAAGAPCRSNMGDLSAVLKRKLSLVRAFLPLFAAFATALFFSEAGWGQGTGRYARVANQLVELINAADYAGIQSKFNKGMSAALPPDKSSAFFSRLTQQAGKIQKLGEPRTLGGAMVFPAEFERGAFDMQITLDGRDLIAGLSFKPPAAKPETEKQTERYAKVANQLVELINAGDHAGIQSKFNKELGTALPLDKATEFFNGLKQQLGKLQKLGKPQSVGGAMVFPAEFEKDALDMQIVLDGRGQIAALNFTPHVAR